MINFGGVTSWYQSRLPVGSPNLLGRVESSSNKLFSTSVVWLWAHVTHGWD